MKVMNAQQETIKEFFQCVIESENDSRYQNETRPAFHFRHNSEKYLGIGIENCEENNDQNSIPDFYVTLADETNINLEVTVLSDEFVEKYNSFFRMFERIARPIIEQNLELLPIGGYLLYYFPGTDKNSLGIDIPSFKYKIGKEQIKNQLISKIPVWIKDYQGAGGGCCFIEDKKGTKV